MADDAWRAATEHLSAEIGLDAADDHASELYGRLNRLTEQIMQAEATTLKGLAVKARVARWMRARWAETDWRDTEAQDERGAVGLVEAVLRRAGGEASV